MVKRMLCLVIGIMFLFGGNGDCGVLTGGSYAVTGGESVIFLGNQDLENNFTSNGMFFNPNKIYRYGDDTDDATPLVSAYTGTLTGFAIKDTASDTDDLVAVVYDSSGNVLAISDVMSDTVSGWNFGTFSGDQQITITSGSSYYIGVGIAGYHRFAINISSWSTTPADSFTWGTIPDPFTNDGSDGAEPIGFYITGVTI